MTIHAAHPALDRAVRRAAVCLLAAGSATGPGAWAEAVPDPRVELAGTWSWTTPDGRCTESQTYREDGTRSVVSGAENTEGTFEVHTLPDSPFRRLVLTTLKDNGGADCGGAARDDSGQTHVVYYLISPEGDRLMYCGKPELQRCVGPFRKTPGRASV